MKKALTVGVCALLTASIAHADVIIGGEVGNGNFEAEKFAAETVACTDVSHWFLIGGNESSTKFGTTKGTQASPDPAAEGRSDRQAAYLFLGGKGKVYAANDTAHTIAAAGETFDVSVAINKFGKADNYAGDEKIKVVLFTSPKGVKSNTEPDDIEVLGETELPIKGAWKVEKASTFYTSKVEDVGKSVYLGLMLVVPTPKESAAAIFPRIDAVELSVAKPATALPTAPATRE